MTTLCGIDEAGRGCMAGPLVITGVILKKQIDGLDDSKKLSKKRREELYAQIIANAIYHICIVKPSEIDKNGLSAVIKNSLEQIVKNIKAKHYIFDGNSNFGVLNIQTQIKADTSIAEVCAASIVAKVTKDRLLLQWGQDFPEFSFSSHQGYLTKKHIEEIKQYGLTPLHRKSYKIKALYSPHP